MQCGLLSETARGAVGYYDDEDGEDGPGRGSEKPCDEEGNPAGDGDLEFEELPCTDEEDAQWEAFIPDDDERDPEPEAGDFWMEPSQSGQERRDES